EVGDTVTIPVTTQNFTEVVGMQYGHSWNPTELDFVEIELLPGSFLLPTNFNQLPALTQQGRVHLAYTEPTTNGISLANGSTLYNLRFIYLGGAAQVTTGQQGLSPEIVVYPDVVLPNYFFAHAAVNGAATTTPSVTTACIQAQSCVGGGQGSIHFWASEDGLTYNWSGPGNYANTTASVDGLAAGNYGLTLTGPDGQTGMANFHVGAPSELSVSLAVDADLCGGSPDGRVETSVSGGSGQYAYLWSNGATADDLDQIAAGSYTVTVTDLAGDCSVEATAVVEQFADLPYTFQVTQLDCTDGNNGAISLQVEAASSDLPLTYSWSSGQTASSIDNLSAGVYFVTITTAQACEQVVSFVLENSAELSVPGATVTPGSCSGGTGGSISIPLAESDYDFAWSNGATTATISDLAAGPYAVTITDPATNCSAIRNFVVQSGDLNIGVNVDCLGNVASAELTVVVWETDAGPFTYTWSDGTTETNNQAASTLIVNEDGTYGVTVTNADGCVTSLDNIQVQCAANPEVMLSITGQETSLSGGETACVGVTAQGFDAIQGFQFTLQWDEDVIAFTSLGDLHLAGLSTNDFNTQLAEDGRLSVAWVSPDLTNGTSVGADSPLFEICFTPATDQEAISTIVFTGFPTAIEFTRNESANVPVSTQGGLVLVNGATNSGGDDIIDLTVGNTTIAQGSTGCVPVTVSDFEDIVGFQFTLAWDPSALAYSGTVAGAIGVGENLLTEILEEGRLRSIWVNESLAGMTLVDNTTLFEICFTATGAEGEYAVQFAEEPLPFQAVNTDFETVGFGIVNGTVTINGENATTTDAKIGISSTTVLPGGDVCVPIQAEVFDNISGMQFTIRWDAEWLNFNTVTFPSNSPFGEDNYHAPAGEDYLQFLWVDANAQGLTLPAGTTLFELCFTAEDGAGVASIAFSNIPTPIEFVQNTQVIPFQMENGQVVITGGAPVWPGDTDNNGVANNFDLLNIGLAHGATGPVRNNAATDWLAQASADWAETTPNTNVNFRHVDTDGNGVINAQDTFALSLNWGQEAEGVSPGDDQSTSGFNGIPVFIPVDTVPAGVQLQLPIHLGTDDNFVEAAYGIAFTVAYPVEMIVPGSIGVEANGWLGTAADDNLLVMAREIPARGEIEVAMVRTDGQNLAGSGQIADLVIIMEDVIIRGLVDLEIDLNIRNVRLIDAQENELSTSPRRTTLLVTGVTSTYEPAALRAIKLSPNPTNGPVQLKATEVEISGLYLREMNGRLLRQLPPGERTFALTDLPNGLYLLEIRTPLGVTHRKLIKQ
ncbi:MAG: cohesin domain-containing protein, partial [Bacteroidota bacterium]